MASQLPPEPPPEWLASPPSESPAPNAVGAAVAPGTYVEVTSGTLTPEQLQALIANPQFIAQATRAVQGSGVPLGATLTTLTPDQAQALAQGKSIGLNAPDRITGWHAIALVGLVALGWTALQAFGYLSTTGDYNSFMNAPACGKTVTDSCRGEYSLSLSTDKSGSSCTLTAHGSAGSWSGVFSAGACDGYTFFTPRSRVEVWRGALVHVWAPSGEYWATDSSVGRHVNALPGLAFPVFLDCVVILAIVLGVVSSLAGVFRRH